MANYLNQILSQYSTVAASATYVFPTVQNLASGKYYSEILDVQEVIDANEALVALDFYHQLTDSNGNVKRVRFRYYEKELPGLAQQLCQYPQVKTWQNAVGLKEDITVAPKSSGNYMRIATRSAVMLTTSSTSTSPTSATSSSPKRGGLTSRLGRRHSSQPVQTVKQSLLSEDEGDDFDDFDDFLTEDDSDD